MALVKSLESRKSASCGLVIAIAVVILLTVGYALFGTVTVPKHELNQTTQPIK